METEELKKNIGTLGLHKRSLMCFVNCTFVTALYSRYEWTLVVCTVMYYVCSL